MSEFKALDDAAFKAGAAHGRRVYATPRAFAARFDKRRGRIVITLDTRIDFAFDPARAPGKA